MEYRVLEVDDVSFSGRIRKTAKIYSPVAHTLDERAQTALKAAMDLQERWKADVVSVYLQISVNPILQERGYYYAVARYAPDGGGISGNQPFQKITWEAKATDFVLSDQDIQIAELWYEKLMNFQVDDGQGGLETDDNALVRDIANELGIAVGDVSFVPMVSLFRSLKSYPTTD